MRAYAFSQFAAKNCGKKHLEPSANMSHFDLIEDRFDRASFIIIGYLRDKKAKNFIDDLIKIIAVFYNISDKWCHQIKGSSMKILQGSNGRKLIKTKSTGFECIFGREIISKGEFLWRLRVNSFHHPVKYNTGGDDIWHIVVGVVDVNRVDLHSITHWNSPSGPGCYMFELSTGQVINHSDVGIYFGPNVTKAGDIIDLKLDLENKSLCCDINGQDIGASIADIKDGQYRLLTNLRFDKTEIQLL